MRFFQIVIEEDVVEEKLHQSKMKKSFLLLNITTSCNLKLLKDKL